MNRSTELEGVIGRLAVATTTGVMPPDLGSWLLEGFQRFKAGGPGADLATALDLKPTKAEQRAERNHYLRTAAAEIEGRNPSQSTWQVAGKLADRIEHFEKCYGQALKFRQVNPASLGDPISEHLCRAKVAVGWAPIGLGRDQIWKIIKPIGLNGG